MDAIEVTTGRAPWEFGRQYAGQQMFLSTEDMLEAAGLNWTVATGELVSARSGLALPDKRERLMRTLEKF